ncbi:MAG: regulatory protein RecX [Coriobacteriia bacterium]
MITELGLRQGDLIDPDPLSARADDLAPRLARERALRLLAARERSAHELQARLVDDGFEIAIAAQTVEALERAALVDDSRLAEAHARTLVVHRGFGRNRVLRELARRGVDESLARQAVDDLAPAEDEAARAHSAAPRIAREGDTVQRLACRLVRRGFAPGEAFRAAETTLAEVDRPDTEGARSCRRASNDPSPA